MEKIFKEAIMKTSNEFMQECIPHIKSINLVRGEFILPQERVYEVLELVGIPSKLITVHVVSGDYKVYLDYYYDGVKVVERLTSNHKIDMVDILKECIAQNTNNPTMEGE